MPATLTGALATQAQDHPDLLFTRFLRRGAEAGRLTYAGAWELAGRWATLLRERGLRRGQPLPLALPNTGDFVGAYFGALRAGGIPAPLAPPRRAEAGDPALSAIAARMRFLSTGLLVVPEALAGIAALPEFAGAAVLTSAQLPSTAGPLSLAGAEDDLALIQFTSGTLGEPKAVQLSHRALLWQTRAISQALRLVDRDEDWAVSWLPLHHDMGLVGFLLTPALHAGNVTLLQTEDFILRPSLWLKALSETRASITGGPPSAYALCGLRIKEAEAAEYDLRRVRVALVGAESVSPQALERFAAKFAPAGFRAESLLPTYGLAENGLAVTMPPLGRGPRFDAVDLPGLQLRGVARPPAGEAGKETRAFASVGGPLPGVKLAIVDRAGARLPERHVGEILVRSPSLMAGYRSQPQETAAALRDGWLHTGDLGYLAGGELFVTGRQKEVLIVAGRTIAPEELEQLAAPVPGVRAGRVAALSRFDAELSTEQAALLAETTLTGPGERAALRLAIRQAVVGAGYPLSEVILLPPKTIQFTPSGKLKRLELRARLLAGEFGDD